MFYKLSKELNMKKYIITLGILITLIALTSCEKDVYTGVTEVEEHNENGKLIIKSNPTGALIFIDDKNMGIKTPDSLNWLPSGQYRIKLKLGYFKDTTLSVSVQDGNTTELDIDYFKNPGHFGKISCNSTPQKAAIYINDSLQNSVTPYTFNNLIPGYYDVRFTYPQHRDYVSRILVNGGKTTFINAALEDTTYWVTYNSFNSGLGSNVISQLIVDKENIMWIGTKDNGLVKFDGKNFTVFNKENSPLPVGNITCLSIDENENLWIGTPLGLAVRNKSGWLTQIPNLQGSYISAIVFDNNGFTWVGTDKGLARYNNTNWTTYTTGNSGLPGNFVTGLALDKNGKLWIGTSAFGIAVLEGNTWTTWNMNNMRLNQNLGNSMRRIIVDKDNNVFAVHLQDLKAGEVGGLSMFDGQSWSVVTLPGFPLNNIENISKDRIERIWICTTGGVAYFDNPSNPSFCNMQNAKFLTNHILSTVIDYNNYIWFGTSGSGLTKYKQSSGM